MRQSELKRQEQWLRAHYPIRDVMVTYTTYAIYIRGAQGMHHIGRDGRHYITIKTTGSGFPDIVCHEWAHALGHHDEAEAMQRAMALYREYLNS